MAFLYFRQFAKSNFASTALCIPHFGWLAKQKLFTLGWLIACALISFLPNLALAAVPGDDCGFQTHTQTYYGATSNGARGAYLAEHFPVAFPNGLTVGYANGRTLKLTSADAVASFLPSSTSNTELLDASYLNPIKPTGNSKKNGTNTYASNLAGQVVALTLSVAFDQVDSGFSTASTQLKDAVLTSGVFAGKTVAFVLEQANVVLGGGTSSYSLGQLTTAVTDINEGYDNGRTINLLTCLVGCNLLPPVVLGPLTYCQGATPTLLSSSVTLLTGALLQVYTTATGGTALPTDFKPLTATVGTATYYVAQTLGTCESSRVPLVVNVVAAPTAPTISPALAVNTSNIAAWGDSFTDANYGRYPATLLQLSGYAVANLGVGGQSSAQIKERMLAAPDKRTWPVIIWAGRNDGRDQIAQTEANIAAMVANLTHTNYLVLPVFNGAGEGKGSYEYQQIMALNSNLARTYGSHYLDVRSHIVSNYNASSAQDVADYAADIPPTSLRQDFLHPNTAGSDLIANYIYMHFDQLFNGGVVLRYCQGEQANPLSLAFTAPSAGATFRYYTSALAPLPLGTGTAYAPSTSSLGSTTYYVSQVVGGCESSRTPIRVEVSDCAAMQARSGLLSGLTNTLLSATGQTLGFVASVLMVYPNPLSNQATVSFGLPKGQAYSLALYNGNGYMVQQIASGTAPINQQYSYSIDGQKLPVGLYTVRLTAGSASQSFRLTVSR